MYVVITWNNFMKFLIHREFVPDELMVSTQGLKEIKAMHSY